MIIEGATRLHNCLVDFRESYISTQNTEHNLSYSNDRELFNKDVLNSAVMPTQTGSDLGRVQGNISQEERLQRVEGLCIRDNLKQMLQGHDMHMPRMNEWYSNSNSHTTHVGDLLIVCEIEKC